MVSVLLTSLMIASWALSTAYVLMMWRLSDHRHLLILTPLLKTVNQGPASVPLLGTWALSALASTFIAISPETTEKDGL